MENEEIRNAENEFFGVVPKPLEMAFVGACLGAVLQYRKLPNTRETLVLVQIPTKKGYQPTIVTFGSNFSVGTAAYEAFYHQLGLEKIIKSKEDPNKEGSINTLLEAFQKRFNLGIGNNYENEILDDKMAKLTEVAKEYFDQKDYLSFLAVKDLYFKTFEQRYSSTRKQQNEDNGEQPKREEPVEEKKTNLSTTTTTQSLARANV